MRLSDLLTRQRIRVPLHATDKAGVLRELVDLAAAGAHVKALSRISRLVRREPVRGKLLSARTPEEFYRALCEAEVP